MHTSSHARLCLFPGLCSTAKARPLTNAVQLKYLLAVKTFLLAINRCNRAEYNLDYMLISWMFGPNGFIEVFCCLADWEPCEISSCETSPLQCWTLGRDSMCTT